MHCEHELTILRTSEEPLTEKEIEKNDTIQYIFKPDTNLRDKLSAFNKIFPHKYILSGNCYSFVALEEMVKFEIDNITLKDVVKTEVPKEPLSFAELFKPEYRDRLTILLDRLQSNGYTNQNNDWLIKTDTNEPAKLFYYLKDRGVIIAPKFAPSIKCFYKNFGCEVVEKFNGNPRATTRRNTESAKYSIDESEYKFLLSWIDKK